MSEAAVGWVVGIFFIILTLMTIIFNIIHFICKWRCRKKHYDEFLNPCHERECLFHGFCKKYTHIHTPKEIGNLKKMVEDFQTHTEKSL